MTEPYLSVWPDEASIRKTEAPWENTAIEHGSDLLVKLFDAEREPIAIIEAAYPDPVWIEVFEPGGTAHWMPAPQPLSLDLARSYPAARYAIVSIRDAEPELAISLSLRTQIGAADVWPAGASSDVAKPVLLIGERFADRERFWAACAAFRTAMATAAPFNSYLASGQLGVIGAWWPQGAEGLFNTQFDPKTRRILGDQKLAMRYADTIRHDAMVVVVVDSPEWGGAGGQLLRQPAWASICDFNPSWANMALHELGHSFGLQDEYVENGPPGYPYSRSYPNVTDRPDADQCIWATQITASLPHNPTQDSAGIPHVPPTTIGTFQGALYDTRAYYRPAGKCRMRAVNDPFCPVCQMTISDQLDRL